MRCRRDVYGGGTYRTVGLHGLTSIFCCQSQRILCFCDFTSISRIQRPLRTASVFSMMMTMMVNTVCALCSRVPWVCAGLGYIQTLQSSIFPVSVTAYRRRLRFASSGDLVVPATRRLRPCLRRSSATRVEQASRFCPSIIVTGRLQTTAKNSPVFYQL